VSVHRKVRLKEGVRESLRVSVSLLPTLVFTLVISEILRERFVISPTILGGLVVYALANTILPSLVFRVPPPQFEILEAPPLATEPSVGVTQRSNPDPVESADRIAGPSLPSRPATPPRG